jgi:single-strand selective monofunctional uracil DNA glycosylase
MSTSKSLVEAAKALSAEVNLLKFTDPVSYVYNPLDYAWESHQSYIEKFGSSKKRIVFMGMNPGPWGMSQTGVPFGEISFVRDWMGINKPVDKPNREHPKRPIVGFECEKSEVSGRRLWGLFAERYQDPASFFDTHFVLNYCPLVFMEESSRNRTPDKLPAIESSALFNSCDRHLRRCIEILEPDWIVGVGGFAQNRAKEALSGFEIRHGKVLHPSPASPAANRGWAEAATKQLTDQGIW